MNPTHRILTPAGRVLLSPAWPGGHAQLLMTSVGVMSSAALIATLTLTAPPPPARAAIAFTDLGNLGMVAIQQGDVAWGDYDGDGDLDLVVAGCGDTADVIMTRLYRNDGGTFVDVDAGLPGVYSGAALAWGDYDGDGDLDLALAGAMDYFFNELVTRVYRNDGGTFTDIAAGLPGLNVIRTGVNAWQVLNTQVETR
jgi:hypothetical protein